VRLGSPLWASIKPYFQHSYNTLKLTKMSKFQTLVNILDVLRKEAPEGYNFYHPLDSDVVNVNKARSRALVHLYLKVKFGLISFQEREKYVTDGINDAGIDGYFIDREKKIIYFIQSKFRDNQANFESKEIKYEELINMEIDRVTEGCTCYECNTQYNSKILNLIAEIQDITDIGRYKYNIIIIANTKDVAQSKLRKLSDGNPVFEYNFEKIYNDLVFPIVTGTYFDQSELVIEINLSNKTSEEISYSVETEFTDCNITALFVPTLEIAKALYKYKNSILKFNPRSYLEMKSGTVNAEIANTIISKKTNEFALFNNGITILSDDTDLNKKIARAGVGQLIITNPQIINGGQTAYTLSRIFEEIIENKRDISVFNNKEVLLKVITFNKDDTEKSLDNKLKLIEAISKATNKQTEVSEADRRSNDKIQIELQNLIFRDFGYFYQRKAGEFGEGLKNKYIDRRHIIDRELFLRLSLACDGKPSQARRTGSKTLFMKTNFDKTLNDSTKYKMYVYAYQLFQELNVRQSTFSDERNNKDGIINYGYALRYGKFAIISAIMKDYKKNKDEDIYILIGKYLESWLKWEQNIVDLSINNNYFRIVKEEETGLTRQIINFDGYYKGYTVNQQIIDYKFLETNPVILEDLGTPSQLLVFE